MCHVFHLETEITMLPHYVLHLTCRCVCKQAHYTHIQTSAICTLTESHCMMNSLYKHTVWYFGVGEKDSDRWFHNQLLILLYNEINNPIWSHKRMAVMQHCGWTSNEPSIGGLLTEKKLLWRRLGWSGIKRSQTDSCSRLLFLTCCLTESVH